MSSNIINMASQKNNTRFITSNKDIGTSESSKSSIRKCVHHIHSYSYAGNVREFDKILTDAKEAANNVNMSDTINIKTAFHFLAPKGSYNKNRVSSRVHDIIASMNDDFNNYTTNPNTMNNFKYKSIINQVFFSNPSKQRTYLATNYIDAIPKEPANITFEIGNIYYYPVRSKLNLSKYDDITEVELEQQAIKSFIHNSRADAIDPEHILNIWIVDMSDTAILGFSSFPWERIDSYHGIVINRRCFFPEDFGESNYNLFKTFTHQLGHYFGLLHTDHTDQRHGVGAYVAQNMHLDNSDPDAGDYIDDTPGELTAVIDPLDTIANKDLHTSSEYNPLFMNFMDGTVDKFVCMFTNKQVRNMRYFINKYRAELNSNKFNPELPSPMYNPDTDTTAGIINPQIQQRTVTLPESTMEFLEHLQDNAIPVNVIDRADITPLERSYSKYAESKSGTGLNTLDPGHKPEPTNLQEVIREKLNRPTGLPRHLERNTTVDIGNPTDRTKNQNNIIMTAPLKPLSSTDQSVRSKLDLLRKIPNDKQKFDQYGLVIMDNVTNRKVRQIEKPQIMKKFTRTKPVNMTNQ